MVLGGGAARGWAHVGVLRALDEAGIKPDLVVGTSIGALIGAVYAQGGISAVEKIVQSLGHQHFISFFDMVLSRSGLMDGRKVRRLLRKAITTNEIKDFDIQFAAVATNLKTGQTVAISSGDPIEAVRASIAVPGLFTPVMKDGVPLVDGGLVDPVPVDVAREMGADYVIAVDISSGVGANGAYLGHKTLDGRRSPSMIEVLLSTAAVTGTALARSSLSVFPPDLLIAPEVERIQFLEFGRADEAIEAGYKQAKEELASISSRVA